MLRLPTQPTFAPTKQPAAPRRQAARPACRPRWQGSREQHWRWGLDPQAFFAIPPIDRGGHPPEVSQQSFSDCNHSYRPVENQSDGRGPV
jgi:hypothetical protein